MTTHPDLICLSHLRWDFEYQRPQQLMSRAARTRRVYYVEPPQHHDGEPHLTVRHEGQVHVVVPHVSTAQPWDAIEDTLAGLLRDFLYAEEVVRPHAWVYTPMMLAALDYILKSGVVYDCMNDLGSFRDAPPELSERERRLFQQADVVFVGDHGLWEAKRRVHPNVHPYPPGVDVPHFAQARTPLEDPADQRHVPHPRLGFVGVIDKRFDLALVAQLAARRPDWHLVFVGPVVKIDLSLLPQGDNIHYLGMRDHQELPAYLAHWDVALLPFAQNAATEFSFPTRAPEYLAAGVPVVSTAVPDVVRLYGEQGLVRIAATAEEFELAVADALSCDNCACQRQADALLVMMSWDHAWEHMDNLVQRAVRVPDARLRKNIQLV
ncbi:glycosyltransferase (plasmid) [Deinococcus radiomollis]|uniref:glycosyltransferase n=1 Tax=Deinococcus radiomollis TaxID=468916 RepID=UPI00389254D2